MPLIRYGEMSLRNKVMVTWHLIKYRISAWRLARLLKRLKEVQ